MVRIDSGQSNLCLHNFKFVWIFAPFQPAEAGQPGYRTGLPGKKIDPGQTTGSCQQLMAFNRRRVGYAGQPGSCNVNRP